MCKYSYVEKLCEIAELKDGWGNDGIGRKIPAIVIERCERMADQMDGAFETRPTLDGGVCFDFDNEDISLEIAICGDSIMGFLSDSEDTPSSFMFETESDAINFWNMVVGMFSQQDLQ